jgi:hypothetical protein
MGVGRGVAIGRAASPKLKFENPLIFINTYSILQSTVRDPRIQSGKLSNDSVPFSTRFP